MGSRRVWSLLNSDAQTPSCFWITNPDNTFVGNHAVGCTIGFYFKLPSSPTGPSASGDKIDIRSLGIGEFRDNVAHSMTQDGLAFHDYAPDTLSTTENFKAYKNLDFGIQADSLGDVVFKNTQLADNALIGIGWMKISSTDMIAQIDGALIVGQTIANSGTDRQNELMNNS